LAVWEKTGALPTTSETIGRNEFRVNIAAEIPVSDNIRRVATLQVLPIILNHRTNYDPPLHQYALPFAIGCRTPKPIHTIPFKASCYYTKHRG